MTTLQFGVAVPGTLAVAGLLTLACTSAFSSLSDDGLTTTLLALLIAIGAIGSFIGSSTTALQALYLSDDIPFLLTLPIPLRVLYVSKFVECALGALPPTVLAFAGILGYGFTKADNQIFWLFAPLLLVSMVAIPTAVSIIIVSVVTRFIPPKRARIFLLVISLTIVSVTVFGWRLLAPPSALGHVVQKNEYASLWRAVSWTPAGWSAQAMSDAAHGRLAQGAILTVLHLSVAFAIMSVASVVFQRTFIGGLDRTNTVQTSAPSETLSAWLTGIAAKLPQRFGALVLREWLSLARDLRRLSGAVWPLGVVLVYTVLLGRNSGAHFDAKLLEFWTKNGSLALLPWGLSLGISVYSYGSEGRSVHLLRSLPASGASIFFAKTLASGLPIGVFSLGTAALSLWLRQQPFLPSLALLGVMTWMIAGYVLIDTSAAALAPNFEAGSVQRTITLTGRLYSFVFGGAFGLATIAVVGRAVLASTAIPARWSEIVHARIGAFEPLGWPLVAFAGLVAAGTLTTSVALAIRQTDRLLGDFP